MKLLALAIAPFLASLLLADDTPPDPSPDPTPEPVANCGAFIRKNPQDDYTIHKDLGTCETNPQYLPHFFYKRTITEDIYQNGSKFFCSTWSLVPNSCAYASSPKPFPSCPGNTCSNLEAE